MDINGKAYLGRVDEEELPAWLEDPEPLLDHLLAHRPAEEYCVSTDGEGASLFWVPRMQKFARNSEHMITPISKAHQQGT